MLTPQISAWVMLVFTGLWTGGILIFAVERINLWKRMPVEQYAVDFRRSLFRVDPLMPILGSVAGIAAVVFALGSTGLAKRLTWTGILFVALVIAASILLAEPINSKFRRLPEGQVPERAEYYRRIWRLFHLGRTVAAIAALSCFAAAVS